MLVTPDARLASMYCIINLNVNIREDIIRKMARKSGNKEIYAVKHK